MSRLQIAYRLWTDIVVDILRNVRKKRMALPTYSRFFRFSDGPRKQIHSQSERMHDRFPPQLLRAFPFTCNEF